MDRKNIFVILLLAILGLNIVGDLFSRTYFESIKGERILSAANIDVASTADSFTQTVSLDCSDVSSPEHCHFGHCPHVYLPGLIKISRSSFSEYFVIQLTEHDSPFLEGLKRPPRILS